jgi:hypothetical protein
MNADVTILTGLALLVLLLMSVMMLTLPRRAAIAPLIITVVLMTIGQQVVIAGAHFTLIRIIILVGWIRIVSRGEWKDLEKNPIDLVLLLWVAASVVIGLIPRAPHPNAVMIRTLNEVLINRAGFAFDALGGYFLARCFVRNTEDITYAIRFLIGVSVMLACFMTIEKATGHNLFSVLGAVPEITMIRDGRFRCQGPFTHPIHAGNFGATLIPLSIGLWFYGKRTAAALGIIAGSLVTFESASSGPLMVWFYGVLAFAFWRYRDRMRAVRWGVLTAVIVLHLVMKAPVWWLIARVAGFVGGGGYWRAKLIDQFVNHVGEWWLIGTNYTAHWSPTGIGLPLYPDMMDITNQFVAEGVGGGLLKLILFIAIIVECYKRIGLVVRDTQGSRLEERFLFWAMGCTLFSYMIAFISVSNSAQTGILYYCLLAFIGCQPKEALDDLEIFIVSNEQFSQT